MQQPLQSPDLLDDSELTTDDRDLDADVTGKLIYESDLLTYNVIHKTKFDHFR